MIKVLNKITSRTHNYVVCLKIWMFFGDQGHISELKLCVDISELRFLILEYAAAGLNQPQVGYALFYLVMQNEYM